MVMPIPNLTATGGSAAPATSGGVGTQGNIGDLTINKKSSVLLPTLIIAGTLLFLGIKGKL